MLPLFLLNFFFQQKKSAVKQLASQIHERALPFVKWLKEAEEEDSDESDGDEEDDDVEVVYDERSRPDKIMEVKEEVVKVSPKKAVVDAIKKEDDIDIDAI